MSIFGSVFFMILTLLLAYYIAVNIYRFFKDKKKYGSEAKQLPKDFTYSQRIFKSAVNKFKTKMCGVIYEFKNINYVEFESENYASLESLRFRNQLRKMKH